MTRGGLARRVLGGSSVRLIGMPISAVLGFVNTSVVIAQVGAHDYGIVSTVATIAVLLPFADLGVGAAVNTAAARAGTSRGATQEFWDTLRAAYRVLGLASLVVIVTMGAIAGFGLWSSILSRPLSVADNWMASAALCVFAIGIPASLGARILMGQGLNELAVSLQLLAPALGLLVTLGLAAQPGRPSLAFALSSYAGLTLAGITNTVAAWLLLRRRYGRLNFLRSRSRAAPKRSVLRGSGAMLIIMMGLPITLETGRLLLAHRSSAGELAEFSLAAQLYAPCWAIASASSGALWRDFVRVRGDTSSTMLTWRRAVLILGAVGIVGGIGLTALGPWVAGMLSHGTIRIDWILFAGFGTLLLMQCIHLPGGVMLTTPAELRWQAGWVSVMALVALTVAYFLVTALGAAGFVLTAAAAICLFQVLPDLFFVRWLITRR